MAISIGSVKLPTGEGVYCGVTTEPYVLIKKGEASIVADDIPEEGSLEAFQNIYQLRYRWYRSNIPRGGAVCSIHPDREATLQCTVCLKCKVQPQLSYHCSPDCLRASWSLHKDYHKQAASSNPGQENGDGGYKHGLGSSTVDQWVEVSRKAAYTPTLEDVGYVLKLEVSLIDRNTAYDIGRAATVYTARVRPTPSPPVRHRVHLVPPPAPGQQAQGRFTVLTYNMLADLYAKQDMAQSVPSSLLHWHYRKRNLLKELLGYNADILCLQEVQSDHYQDFWAPELQRAGYAAIYKRKTQDHFTGGGSVADGCATFFRRDRFNLVKKYEVEFNKAALSLADQVANPQQKKATLNRLLKDNVALIAVLEALDIETANKRTLVCVANTHIHANPELNDVKLWQVHTLLKGLEKIAASADIPMLVAGDFNSTPGSPAHSLLVTGKVDPITMEQCIDPLNIIKDSKISHQLPLVSAYAQLANAPASADNRLHKQRQRLDTKVHEPLFTNITKDFKGTLDYILYTHTSLQPTAVLELPAEAEVLSRPDETLPNAQYSSDHIALLAEFQYIRS